MDPEILFCILGVLAVLAVVGIVSWLLLHFILKPENMQKELQRQAALQRKEQTDPFDPQFTTEEIQATVIDQSCTVKLVGIKTPKATKIFTIVFRTTDEKVVSYDVPEEMYDGFEKGQTGLLTIVDGELYGFAPEE